MHASQVSPHSPAQDGLGRLECTKRLEHLRSSRVEEESGHPGHSCAGMLQLTSAANAACLRHLHCKAQLAAAPRPRRPSAGGTAARTCSSSCSAFWGKGARAYASCHHSKVNMPSALQRLMHRCACLQLNCSITTSQPRCTQTCPHCAEATAHRTWLLGLSKLMP